MVGRSLIVFTLVLCLTLLGFSSNHAEALSVCTEVDVVGVRGSGQAYGQSPELSAIKNSLPAGHTFTELDNVVGFLSAEPEYVSAAVKGDIYDDAVGLVALVSRSNMGKYRESVDSGKNLLKKYIEHNQSTDTCLVLVGYSQGAQVIGETVQDMHKADPRSLKNVIYIGLLGDPQFSPVGFDTSRKPTWFRGNALYPFTGVLGARMPDYVPRSPVNSNYPFTKIGSWCNYGDVICATNVTHYAAMRDGHASYVTDGIPEMVDEIKVAIANPDQNITGAIYPESVCGAPKQDLVVLLDTSAYMRRNKGLFTKDRNDWDRKLLSGTNIPMLRTFGEQLLDSGCGDKRIAIVGFEGPSGQPPRVLLDFTNQAKDIDELMESLYTPSSGGVAERPQLREAAILAMRQNWRTDASRTLFALTAMAGSGDVTSTWRESWATNSVMERYMSDGIGQQLLALSRQTRASMITAPYLPIDMSGFSIPSGYPASNDAHNYLQGLARLTGGYNWEKQFFLYTSIYTVKNVDFSQEIQQFEKRRDATRATMPSVKAKVGQTVTLSLNDTANLLASAGVRGHGTGYEWYLECDALQKRTDYPTVKQQGGIITFTPTKAGSCMGAVQIRVQGSGNGCYWGCPEPFPPYMMKTIPFRLEVLAADYVDKIPGPITTMAKTIYDDRVELTWSPSVYEGGDKPVYLVKDTDGAVLAATYGTSAVVTDTDRQDIDVLVQAIGADGRSPDFSSANDRVQVVDKRIVVDDAPSALPSNDLDTNDGTADADSGNADGGDNPAVTLTAVAHATPLVAEPEQVAEELQGSTVEIGEGQTLGRSITEPARTLAQVVGSPAPGQVFSWKWLWLLPIVVLVLWGIVRASSRVRRQ